MRISDWSSDVCSSDLHGRRDTGHPQSRPHDEQTRNPHNCVRNHAQPLISVDPTAHVTHILSIVCTSWARGLNKKLTLRLDDELISSAKRYSARSGKSL